MKITREKTKPSPATLAPANAATPPADPADAPEFGADAGLVDSAPLADAPAPKQPISRFSPEVARERIKAIAQAESEKIEVEASRLKNVAAAEAEVCADFCYRCNLLAEMRLALVTFETDLDKRADPALFKKELHFDTISWRSGNPPGSGATIRFDANFRESMSIEFLQRHRDQILADAQETSVGKLERELAAFRAANEAVLARHGFLD
jgi:hypothetical protein